jgi:hypothetical protein
MRIIAALLIALLPSVALSRAAPRYNVHETCVGMLEHSQYSNPGWYSIDICFFGPGSASDKILAVCHEGQHCTVQAVGHTDPDFYIDRVIRVHQP